MFFVNKMQKLPAELKKTIQSFSLEHPTANMIKQLTFERVRRGIRNGIYNDDCLRVRTPEGKMDFRYVDFVTTSWQDWNYWSGYWSDNCFEAMEGEWWRTRDGLDYYTKFCAPGRHRCGG